MKRKRLIITGSFILISAILVIAIATAVIKWRTGSKGVFDEDYLLAAFDSTEGWKDSTVVYYDKEFQPVYEQRIPMGSMADSFSPPVRYDDKIYAAPQGIGTERDIDQVLEIDTKTGKYKTYKTGQFSVVSLAVSERYIFTVNNWGDARLARTDKKTGEVKELEFPDENIFQIDVYEDRLYVFPKYGDQEGETPGARCVILDIESLEAVDSFDMTAYGDGVEYTYMKDGKLYMPLSYTCTGEYNDCLLCYDTAAKELKAINLGKECPAQILEWKGWLVITHVDMVSDEAGNCEVTLYHPQTGERKRYWVPGSVLDQVAVKGDCMYALDIQKKCIYIYNLNSTGERLELLEWHSLKTKDQDSRYYYYAAGFFLK